MAIILTSVKHTSLTHTSDVKNCSYSSHSSSHSCLMVPRAGATELLKLIM